MKIEEVSSLLSAVKTIDEFKSWSRDVLRLALPHGALVSGLGHLHAGGVGLDFLVLTDFPATHIEAIRNRAGAIETPILRRWLATQAPVYFDIDDPWPDAAPAWLESFSRHGMRNVLAHAKYDQVRCVGTYFSLFQIPGTPDPEYISRLVHLLPTLHEALCRCIDHAKNLSPLGLVLSAMNDREQRMIQWLRFGKTNAEIAELVGLSENTVKHYVSDVFDRMGVSNRAQLVRRLAELETMSEPGAGTLVL